MTSTPTRGDLTVKRSHGDAVVHLVLDRPEARNALSGDLMASIEEQLLEASHDEVTRAIVISGTSPGFCAGSDLKELGAMTVDEMARHEAETGRVVRMLQQVPVPVVAAVEGFALGGGFLLATACDIVVSADNARWHLPEVPLGWVPPWGISTLLNRVSPVMTRRLVWGERPLTGAELRSLGVVDEVTVPGDAVAHALRLAGRLAELPRHAVRSTKLALANATLVDPLDLDNGAARLFAADCESAEAQRSLERYLTRARQATS